MTARLLPFESARDLTGELAATQSELDALDLKAHLLNGLRLHIETLRDCIKVTKGTMREVYVGKLAAAERQMEMAREWDGRVTQ